MPPDLERLSEYVTRLVQSQFGLLAEDPIFVEKQFLDVLGRSRFPIADVLATSPGIARQLLARLQADAELHELVQKPETDDDDWNEQVERAVKRTLAEFESTGASDANGAASQGAPTVAHAAANEERQPSLEEVLRELEHVRRELERVSGRVDRTDQQLAQAHSGILSSLFRRRRPPRAELA